MIFIFVLSIVPSYESACEEYLKALELLQKTAGEQDHGNPALKAITSIKIQFVVNRVSM